MIPPEAIGTARAEPVGAPSDEIEVTPAMIAAGAAALYAALDHIPQMSSIYAETLAEMVISSALGPRPSESLRGPG